MGRPKQERKKQLPTSTTSGTGDILCPYFVAHSREQIICEGDIPDCRCSLLFKDEADKAQQQKLFCESNYKMCPHYFNVCRFDW